VVGSESHAPHRIYVTSGSLSTVELGGDLCIGALERYHLTCSAFRSETLCP